MLKVSRVSCMSASRDGQRIIARQSDKTSFYTSENNIYFKLLSTSSYNTNYNITSAIIHTHIIIMSDNDVALYNDKVGSYYIFEYPIESSHLVYNKIIMYNHKPKHRHEMSFVSSASHTKLLYNFKIGVKSDGSFISIYDRLCKY